MLIKESFLLTATDADILAAPSRLAAIPKNGVLTVQASATQNNGTNRGVLTLQLPEGDIPFDSLNIPFSGFGADGVLDKDRQLLVTMQVMQGGHVGLAYTEVGTVALAYLIVTLNF